MLNRISLLVDVAAGVRTKASTEFISESLIFSSGVKLIKKRVVG